MSDRFTTRILSAGDEARWEALWRRSGAALGRHWRWVDFAAAGVGEPVRVGVFAGDALIAGAPFVLRRRRLRTGWYHPAPMAWAGVMTGQDTGESETAMRDVLQALASLEAKGIWQREIVFSPTQRDVRGLLWEGWSAQPHYNYVSEISQLGDLSRQCENSARRQAAKARDAGMALERGPQLLGELLALWDETRARKNLPAYVAAECFQKLMEYTSATPGAGISADVFGIRNPEDGKLAAGAFIGGDAERAYYLLGATRLEEGAKGTGAPTLLHLSLTDALVNERGRFVYDWVGANTKSVVAFKKNFRPRLEECHRVSARRPGLLSL